MWFNGKQIAVCAQLAFVFIVYCRDGASDYALLIDLSFKCTAQVYNGGVA